jgi:hypothetical protein
MKSTMPRVDFASTRPELAALCRCARAHDVERGGRDAARAAAVNLGRTTGGTMPRGRQRRASARSIAMGRRCRCRVRSRSMKAFASKTSCKSSGAGNYRPWATGDMGICSRRRRDDR